MQYLIQSCARGGRRIVENMCYEIRVCVYYCSTYYKAVRGGGGGVESGGHVLRETTSRGQCELVCPSRTNERGREGYCVKGGGEEDGERERERAGRVRLHYILGY